MGSVKVERIDHLGIVAGVIQDLGIIDMEWNSDGLWCIQRGHINGQARH